MNTITPKLDNKVQIKTTNSPASPKLSFSSTLMQAQNNQRQGSVSGGRIIQSALKPGQVTRSSGSHKLQVTSPTAQTPALQGGTASTLGDGGANQLLSASQNLMEFSQSFNLQYLYLQENMQMQNREYSSVSNASKSQHGTASGIIQNARVG
jgi:hypothetical protein